MKTVSPLVSWRRRCLKEKVPQPPMHPGLNVPNYTDHVPVISRRTRDVDMEQIMTNWTKETAQGMVPAGLTGNTASERSALLGHDPF